MANCQSYDDQIYYSAEGYIYYVQKHPNEKCTKTMILV